MTFFRPYAIATTIALFWVANTVWSEGSETTDERIARALRAAPASISGNATIDNGDGEVLRTGTNGWTCMPDVLPGQPYPMCNEEVWNRLMKAVSTKAPFQAERMSRKAPT